MKKKKATVHFSSFDRVVHVGGDSGYFLTSLPFVMTAEAEYPRSYEVQVKEYPQPGTESARFDVLISPEQRAPIAYEVLRAIALDFYSANRQQMADRRRSALMRVVSRSYAVELEGGDEPSPPV